MEDEKKDTVEYRLSFLTKDEDQSAVRSAFSAHGAEITHEEPPQKVRLAYPIQKQQFAFSGSLLFRAVPEALTEALSAVRREQSVLRAMAVRDFPSDEEKKMGVSTAVGRGRGTRRPVRERSFRSQLSNEALEKKIEEISQ